MSAQKPPVIPGSTLNLGSISRALEDVESNKDTPEPNTPVPVAIPLDLLQRSSTSSISPNTQPTNTRVNTVSQRDATIVRCPRDEEIAVFDLETTVQTTVENCRILEYACSVRSSYTLFEAETLSYEDRSGVGIPTTMDQAERIRAIMHGRTWVGYNIVFFDIPILKASFKRAAAFGVQAPVPTRIFDLYTHVRTSAINGSLGWISKLPNKKLDTIMGALGMHTQRHTAIDDVRDTVAVLKVLSTAQVIKESSVSLPKVTVVERGWVQSRMASRARWHETIEAALAIVEGMPGATSDHENYQMMLMTAKKDDGHTMLHFAYPYSPTKSKAFETVVVVDSIGDSVFKGTTIDNKIGGISKTYTIADVIWMRSITETR